MTRATCAEADLPLLVAIGCLNVDIVARVPALPASDARVMSGRFEKHLGGMAANAACAAAGLGPPWRVRTELIAPLGGDEHSRWVEASLAEKNVGTDWLDRDCSARASLCLILVEAQGARAIVSEPSRLRYDLVERRLLSDCDTHDLRLAHVDGFHAGGVLELFERARSAGWRTSLDVDELSRGRLTPTAFTELLAAFDVVFLSSSSAKALFVGSSAESWVRDLTQWSSSTKTIFLLTLGADGAIVVEPDVAPVHLPAIAVPTIDSTGAGDVFAGVFLSCWLNGIDALDAAHKANIGAALSTTGRGALGFLPDAAAIEARATADER